MYIIIIFYSNHTIKSRYLRLTKRLGHGFWCSKFFLLGWGWGFAQTADNWAIAWSWVHINLSSGNKNLKTWKDIFSLLSWHWREFNFLFWALFGIFFNNLTVSIIMNCPRNLRRILHTLKALLQLLHAVDFMKFS